MQPTKELVDALYREEVLRARAMRPEDRMLEGLRLFDRACQIMKYGIRDQFPNADEEEVNRILAERLALARRLEGKW